MIGTTMDPNFNRAVRLALTQKFANGDQRQPRHRRSGRKVHYASCICSSRELVPEARECARHKIPLNKRVLRSFV